MIPWSESTIHDQIGAEQTKIIANNIIVRLIYQQQQQKSSSTISIQYYKTKVKKIWMQSPKSECQVCLTNPVTSSSQIKLPCNHIFCTDCVVKYIETLRSYNLLTPEKLCCLCSQTCKQQIPDSVITKLFPGQVGFVLCIVRKRYRQSKDKNIVIFDCKSFTTQDRKPLIPKSPQLSSTEHSKKTTQLTLKLMQNPTELSTYNGKKCTNILSFNKSIPRKQNYTQCMVCCCMYCISCFGVFHEGTCKIVQAQLDAKLISGNGKQGQTGTGTGNQQIDNFVERNGILRCLNSKCGVAIAKEEGCFWVKCRCSWEMCYPCQKLWGDCEHFSKYPYKKFVPPPQWMVKALNLY